MLEHPIWVRTVENVLMTRWASVRGGEGTSLTLAELIAYDLA